MTALLRLCFNVWTFDASLKHYVALAYDGQAAKALITAACGGGSVTWIRAEPVTRSSKFESPQYSRLPMLASILGPKPLQRPFSHRHAVLLINLSTSIFRSLSLGRAEPCLLLRTSFFLLAAGCAMASERRQRLQRGIMLVCRVLNRRAKACAWSEWMVQMEEQGRTRGLFQAGRSFFGFRTRLSSLYYWRKRTVGRRDTLVRAENMMLRRKSRLLAVAFGAMLQLVRLCNASRRLLSVASLWAETRGCRCFLRSWHLAVLVERQARNRLCRNFFAFWMHRVQPQYSITDWKVGQECDVPSPEGQLPLTSRFRRLAVQQDWNAALVSIGKAFVLLWSAAALPSQPGVNWVRLALRKLVQESGSMESERLRTRLSLAGKEVHFV